MIWVFFAMLMSGHGVIKHGPMSLWMTVFSVGLIVAVLVALILMVMQVF